MAGEATAVTAIADAIAEQLDEDEQQFGLWSEPTSDAGRAKLVSAARRGGRPPGARNKRTEATVAHLLQRYRDPRAVALERIQMHPADLAAILGCTVYEASQEQRLYLTAVAPFLHARITPDVIDQRQVIHLTINGLGAGADGLAAPAAVHVLDPEEYQRVSDEAGDDL